MAVFNKGYPPAEFHAISVMHTGSKFLCDHLLREHRREWTLEHILTDTMGHVLQLAGERPIIVPMRHPIDVAVSHFTRYESVDRMTEGFRGLVQVVDPFKPYYLPIDVPHRQAYLDRINSRFGLSLETRWPIIGSCWERKELPAEAQYQVDELVAEFTTFFERFGYKLGESNG